MNGQLEVEGRSVALLMEDGLSEPVAGPQHTSIPVIEVEMSPAEPSESEP